MNLWSLAVEEQFYLLWPLAVLAARRASCGARRPAPRPPSGSAVLSSVLMAVRLDPESPTRVYFGTDTHVMGLMLGAALAFAWAAPHRAWTTVDVVGRPAPAGRGGRAGDPGRAPRRSGRRPRR